MIYQDKNKFPTDGISKDYMDSAVRAGILNVCNNEKAPNLQHYVRDADDYEFMRGPVTTVARNAKNFSRDQMLCLVAGLSKTLIGRYCIAMNLSNRILSGFIAQNVERDVTGSTKYLKPHWFYNDSQPSAKTVFVKSKLDQQYSIEYRKADGADLLLPQHIWHMIKASKGYILYPYAIVGIPCYILDLIVHSYKKDKFEENQMMCMTFVQGSWAKWLYKKLNKTWRETSYNYWNDRGEIEYHYMLVEEMNK